MIREIRPSEDQPSANGYSISTTDDDGRPCTLEGTGLAHHVKITRIGQHQGRPALYEDLDERMRGEVRLWARSLLGEGGDPVACHVKAHCRRMLEDFEEDGEAWCSRSLFPFFFFLAPFTIPSPPDSSGIGALRGGRTSAS